MGGLLEWMGGALGDPCALANEEDLAVPACQEVQVDWVGPVEGEGPWE